MNVQKYQNAIRRVLASRLFFKLGLVWFGLQASWLAFTGLYPMAFDEKHHFELIHVYTDKWLPFWSNVPEGSTVYGAIARDPSYMYHYLLSFPMRAIEPLIGSQTGQVILVRLVSVAMFVFGIVLFRKLLHRAGCGKALTNVVLLIFSALPLVTLLAAQVNYDNLLFVLTPACLLYLQKIVSQLQAKNQLDVKSSFQLAILAMFAALTKYAFLPVIVAMIIVLTVSYVRYTKGNLRQRWSKVNAGLESISPKIKLILIGMFIVLFGLCFERYGINTIRYGSPAPECDQVLSIEECKNFSPWLRNYNTRQSKLRGEVQKFDNSFYHYFTKIWFDKTNYQLFYTLDGPRAGYVLGRPYPILHGISLKLAAIGTVLFLAAFWKIRKIKQLGYLLFISGVYAVTLIIQNYSEFLHLGYPFGIQARYLIPFLPIAGAALASGYNYWLRKATLVKEALACFIIFIFLTQGGGVATYILRSQSDWYWPNSIVINSNDYVRRVLMPFILKD